MGSEGGSVCSAAFQRGELHPLVAGVLGRYILWLLTQRPEDDLAFRATFLFSGWDNGHAAFGDGRLGATGRALVPVDDGVESGCWVGLSSA